MTIVTKTTCPTCGARCTVAGSETHYYVPQEDGVLSDGQALAPEVMDRTKINKAVREMMILFADAMNRHGSFFITSADTEVWKAVADHPGVQERLAIKKKVSELEAENKRLLTENKELCEELGIEWTELPGEDV